MCAQQQQKMHLCIRTFWSGKIHHGSSPSKDCCFGTTCVALSGVDYSKISSKKQRRRTVLFNHSMSIFYDITELDVLWTWRNRLNIRVSIVPFVLQS